MGINSTKSIHENIEQLNIKPISIELNKKPNSIEEIIMNGDAFYFRGNKLFLLTTKCALCDTQRFTPEQVKKLSDKNLTKKQFDEEFNFKYEHDFLCKKLDCRIKVRDMTQQGITDHNFDFYWMFFSKEQDLCKSK